MVNSLIAAVKNISEGIEDMRSIMLEADAALYSQQSDLDQRMDKIQKNLVSNVQCYAASREVSILVSLLDIDSEDSTLYFNYLL